MWSQNDCHNHSLFCFCLPCRLWHLLRSFVLRVMKEIIKRSVPPFNNKHKYFCKNCFAISERAVLVGPFVLVLAARVVCHTGVCQWWNGTTLTAECRSAGRRTCPGATFFTTTVAWIGLALNPCLWGERPARDRLMLSRPWNWPFKWPVMSLCVLGSSFCMFIFQSVDVVCSVRSVLVILTRLPDAACCCAAPCPIHAAVVVPRCLPLRPAAGLFDRNLFFTVLEVYLSISHGAEPFLESKSRSSKNIWSVIDAADSSAYWQEQPSGRILSL
jgi:hypothetical protein